MKVEGDEGNCSCEFLGDEGLEGDMDASESNSVEVLNYKVPELFQNSNAQTIQRQPPSDFFTLVEDLKTTNDIQTTTWVDFQRNKMKRKTQKGPRAKTHTAIL